MKLPHKRPRRAYAVRQATLLTRSFLFCFRQTESVINRAVALFSYSLLYLGGVAGHRSSRSNLPFMFFSIVAIAFLARAGALFHPLTNRAQSINGAITHVNTTKR
ncbi:MAG TPA: hypothetical protein VII61_16170 [Ktedonobacteraceae bacterium]